MNKRKKIIELEYQIRSLKNDLEYKTANQSQVRLIQSNIYALENRIDQKFMQYQAWIDAVTKTLLEEKINDGK